MREEILSIASDLREGSMTLKEAQAQLLRLLSVVGRSEQLKAEVFTLANKLAVAGEGDAAVAMHRIHNRL